MMTRAAGLLVLLASARAGIPLGPPKGLLSFEICGGLTNQRIALIEGLIIAQLTHRAVVLPALNPNGVQTGAISTILHRESAKYCRIRCW